MTTFLTLLRRVAYKVADCKKIFTFYGIHLSFEKVCLMCQGTRLLLSC